MSEALDELELRAITRWKQPDSWFGTPWDGWYVGLGQHRDSDCLSRSNFQCFVEAVSKASDKLSILKDDMGYERRAMEIDSVFIVSESHWAVGWIEWVAIHESDIGALQAADEIMCALDDYPVVNEDHWSDLEWNEIHDYWEREPVRYRLDICKDCGESIFAARRDTPTEKIYDWLRDGWS